MLDAAAMRAEVDSPTYLGGVWDRSGAGLVHPGRLVAGLRDAALRRRPDPRRTPAVALAKRGDGVTVTTPGGAVRARRVLLATSAYPRSGAAQALVVAVHDYVLVTEPLSAAQKDAIGWRQRQGIGDAGDQFHYYRLTATTGSCGAASTPSTAAAARSARTWTTTTRPSRRCHSTFTTFPQLEGLRFTHRWAARSTPARASRSSSAPARRPRRLRDRLHGPGRGRDGFGARVGLDLLDGRANEATTLAVRPPQPCRPHPSRCAPRHRADPARLARADRDGGRRGPWLRALDRLGLGFDS